LPIHCQTHITSMHPEPLRSIPNRKPFIPPGTTDTLIQLHLGHSISPPPVTTQTAVTVEKFRVQGGAKSSRRYALKWGQIKQVFSFIEMRLKN